MDLPMLGPSWGPLARRAAAAAESPTEGSWVPQVCAYLDEVVAWNRRTDLTAARSVEELVDLTVTDAAIVAARSEPGRFVDVGSGAGAPGLVLALMRPDISVLLVEPRGRRVAFLRNVIGRLGLGNVRVERKRSDALPGGGWDVALSRATLPASEWLVEGARLARRGIWVFLAREETPSAPGLSVDLDVRYEWPLTAVPRRAVRFAHSR